MKILIEKLIFEGFGLGRDPGGKSIFVRKAVPEDELEVEVVKDKKGFSEAIIKNIIQPSKYRTESICPYFNDCGGCEHQNIGYEDQLKFKGDIFTETLKRQGIDCKIEPIIHGSSEPFYYRNSIRFFFVLDKEKNITFARHNFQYDKGYVFIDKCYLQSETCNEILTQLKNFINQEIQDKSLFWQLKIRDGKFTNEFMIEIITSGEYLPQQKEIVEVLRSITNIKSIYHTVAPGKSLKGLKRRLIYGSPIIHEKI